jgi:hypothetical protein
MNRNAQMELNTKSGLTWKQIIGEEYAAWKARINRHNLWQSFVSNSKVPFSAGKLADDFRQDRLWPDQNSVDQDREAKSNRVE